MNCVKVRLDRHQKGPFNLFSSFEDIVHAPEEFLSVIEVVGLGSNKIRECSFNKMHCEPTWIPVMIETVL